MEVVGPVLRAVLVTRVPRCTRPRALTSLSFVMPTTRGDLVMAEQP